MVIKQPAYTLWTLPSNLWRGIPQDLEISAQTAQKIRAALKEPVSEGEVRAYKTPVDLEKLIRIIV